MPLSNKERQKQWKERQRHGGKKMITVMLSDEAYNLLAKTKEETGDLFPNIIERAIFNLCLVTSNENIEKIETINPIKETPQERSKEETLKLIVELKEKQNLSFEKIAQRLNREGIMTFSGTGKWHGKTVYKIYNRTK